MFPKSEQGAANESNQRRKPVMEYFFVFEAFGVKGRVESNDEPFLASVRKRVEKAFLRRAVFSNDFSEQCQFRFGLFTTETDYCELWQDDAFYDFSSDPIALSNFFISYLRATVAELARDLVFVHAGVVAVAGSAILIPGNSYSGKTTLVAELVKKGAEYFSDEYAVLDEAGLVHPFARDLEMRGRRGSRDIIKTISAKALGGQKAAHPKRAGMVLLTEYSEGSNFTPVHLSLGNGIKEIIPHTIPIRKNTAFALKVLNKTLEHAIILKGSRGEASQFADFLVSYIDKDSKWPIKAAN